MSLFSLIGNIGVAQLLISTSKVPPFLDVEFTISNMYVPVLVLSDG